MTEEKANEKTPEEIEAKRKETTRQLNLGFLTSQSVNDSYIAAIGTNEREYGNSIKEATQTNYLKSLQNIDSYTGKILGQMIGQNAANKFEKGQDIYESQMFSPKAYLKNIQKQYEAAVNGIKVTDLTALMGIKDIHENNISKEDRELTLAEFSKKNANLYGDLVENYLLNVQQTGIANSLMQNSAFRKDTLENILKTDLKKLEEENKKQ
ncbi:hypothetical protein GW932_00510 [archaeon]|nr:hypothetical protein [archaeon]